MPNAKPPNPVDIHVGGRVRMYRIKGGVSQDALGKQLGLTFQQVQKYERGTNRIGASRLHQISKILNVSVASLFEGLPRPKRSGADNSIGEFVELMETPLGQRLVQGVMQISEKDVRGNLTRLVESLAKDRAPPEPRWAKKKKSA